ncbi:hypothetical protein ACUNWD_02425 [Sunxiuqinia sp. A32]|uniref:hypothetical protein n=1 Tax=Sunxiuqinia sp. A32 TaxID=3461496 RepID=UPI004046395F
MELINYTTLSPTIGGSFSNGWEVMKKYFLYLLIVVIVVGIVSGPSMQNRYDSHDFEWSIGFAFLVIFAIAYALLLVPVFQYSSKLIYLDAVRDKEIDLKKLVAGFNNYLNVILANLLKVTLIVMGFLFFIVPGIILACRLAFVSYLVMDKNMDPVQALEKSWKMTRGIGWNIFFMAIISFFIGVAGFILLIVGIFPALIWIHSSFASLYQGVLNREEVAVI